MRRMTNRMLAGLLAAAGFLAMGPASGLAQSALPPPPPGQGPSTLTIPAGATLRIRLGTTLTSKTNKTGDRFTGMVKDPVVSNGKVVIPEGSLVDGHVAFVKPPGRVKAKAEMRVVLDNVTTPDEVKLNLSAGLADANTAGCAKTGSDDEGTLRGCGKSKKDAAKDAAIGGALGASAGATVGLGHEIDCRYYGNCGGPGMGTDVGYGAALGAGTTLIYNLFKHEKDVILIEGTNLTFVVNRSVMAPEPSPEASPDSAQ